MTTDDPGAIPRIHRVAQPNPPPPDHTHTVHGVVTAVAAVGAAFALVVSIVALAIVATRPATDDSATAALSLLAGRVLAAELDALPAIDDSPPTGPFTPAEVAVHDNPAISCWVVVDGLVFDLTEASKLHPARFQNCGGDSSEVYHRQHGLEIRDKMMQHYIGALAATTGVAATTGAAANTGENEMTAIVPAGCPPENVGGPIDPHTSLFAAAGSWNTNDLMVVVEKDCRSIVFIDGSTHTPVGRIDDLGHQMHAPTMTPDGRYVFVIARDGWLSKIDLTTFEVVGSLDVGISSRGTGLTDDGKYLLVGNFEPNTAVLLDAVTLEIVKTFEATGSINGGPETPSKVGGIVERGTRFYMVLKDVNAVWEIETADPDFPVRKYEDLGDGRTPLHDAYLTPDGQYLIAAVQGANVVWVLDTGTGEEVAEVPTGETPHTGPGATVGNLTFVPTLDPTGIISVIDTDTWTNVKNIEVGGPGLFIRHNPTAEDPAEYPFVWAETAFGDHHDEIYVIDVRSLEIVETLKPVPGESSWHPEFTFDGNAVYVVSQTGNTIVVYDADDFAEIARIPAKTPSSVFNVGLRTHEAGL
jgi:YVTN family beta-propeller protein